MTPPPSPAQSQNPGSMFWVDLYEWDGGSNRHLGSAGITWTHSEELRSVPFFAANDYSYTLSFLLKDVGAGNCVQYVTVPNMIGQYQDYAEDVLDNNFIVDISTVENCLKEGRVVYQNPRGVDRPQWSTVHLTIATCDPNWN